MLSLIESPKTGIDSRVLGNGKFYLATAEISDLGWHESNWRRSIQRSKDRHRFRYGELPQDDPEQVYVKGLANRLPQISGFPFRVIVCPDWRVVNAVSLPDGTIYLSSELIRQAETEEALLGVIAHERVHAYREHAKKSVSRYSDSVSDILADLGMVRGHEYEADLRGALVDLEKAGVNPIGYKVFLEKMHKEEKRDIFGVVHGSSLDRALNIASAIHLIDISSIAQDLHPIPDEFLKPRVEWSPYSRRPILSRPKDVEPSFSGLREERRRTVEALRSTEIPLAIQFIYEYASRHYEEKDRDPEDEELLYKLFDRFKGELLPQDLSSDDKRRLQILGIQLFSGVDILGSEKRILDEQKEEARRLLDSATGWENARRLLLRFVEETQLSYIVASPTEFLGSVIDFAMSGKAFGDFKNGNTDIKNFRKFIDGWVEVGTVLSDKLSTGRAGSTDEIKTFVLRRVVANVPVETQENLSESLGTTKKKEEGFEQFYAIGVILGRISDIKRLHSELRRYREELEKHFNGKSLKEIGTTLQQIIEGMREAQKSTFPVPDSDEPEQIEAYDIKTFIYSPERIAIRLLEGFLRKLSQFADLTPVEKQLIVSGIAYRLRLVSDLTSLKTSWSYGLEESRRLLSSSERAEMERGIRTVEKWSKIHFSLKSSKQATLGEVITTYKYLVDRKAFNDLVGFSEISGDEKENTYRDVTDLSRREEIFVEYLTSWLADKNFGEILRQIGSLQNGGIPAHELLGKSPQSCGPLVVRLTEAIESNELPAHNIPDLIAAASWIANPFLRAAFQRYVRESHWRNLSFEEKLDLVLPKAGEGGISDPHTQEEFLEDEITTKEQYEIVKRRIAEKAETFLTEGSAESGIAALLSQMNFQFRDVNAFIEALLKSSEDDRGLKRIIYGLVSAEVGRGVSGFETEEDAADQEAIDNIKTKIYTADALARSLYTLDNFGKQLLLRSLLTSDWGALPNREKRGRFLSFVFEKWLERKKAEDDIYRVFGAVKEALGEIPEWQLLYFGIQNALRDKIAIPPSDENMVSWADMYEIESDLESEGLSEGQIKKFFRGVQWEQIPKSAQREPYRYHEQYVSFAERRLRDELISVGALEEPRREKFTPLQFVEEVISRTGAPGVRFLQLLPQFVDIPPEYEKEFSEVYDGIKGQSKLAALLLLEREWPQVWNEVSSVEERVGGGSAVTVYRAKKHSGETVVLKVRNPNIEYHLEETYRFVAMVTDILARRHGGAYSASRSALDDIKRWIGEDINFQGFLAKDAKFHERYNNYRVEGIDYSIKVPTSYQPGSKYFAVEEFIEGKNLTQWDELVRDGHDMKQIVSLLLRNYIEQIMDGVVHSDVHIGNFRVTSDKQVAILDRNFYLQISQQEQAIITSLFNPFSSSESRMQELLSYLQVDSSRVGFDKIRQTIGNITDHLANQRWDLVRRSIIALKQMGVVMSFNLTLLLKNINSLRMMAERAGFNNLTEVFLYTPTG